jgi:hypothetical protein
LSTSGLPETLLSHTKEAFQLRSTRVSQAQALELSRASCTSISFLALQTIFGSGGSFDTILRLPKTVMRVIRVAGIAQATS